MEKFAVLLSFYRKTVVPLFLMVTCPPAAFLMWYICSHLDGSLLRFLNFAHNEGFFSVLWAIMSPVFWGSRTAWSMILVFMSLQWVLMWFLPGPRWTGPVTPQGNVPEYRANGPLAFLVTLCLFFIAWGLHLFDPAVVYDHFGEIIGALNILSFGFCFFLYLKGRFKPSSSDCGLSGNFIFDYYWGTELYPRIGFWDLKMFTNCRFGMMSWPIIVLSFAAKQAETVGLSDAMWVSVVIQLVYVAKFFAWEGGYLRSIDIMHDRAGFYICWGCLVWVPAIYTSPALYLVNHPVHLGAALSLLIVSLGVGSILLNYWADRQREQVRSTEGNCFVWGKKPQLIRTCYRTSAGEEKQGILLASGFWGLARHFHYLPEILGAFFWTVPALFNHVLPYFYVIFLTILLIHRSYRDDERCTQKYGSYWKEYCQKVPYRIVPGFRSSGYFLKKSV